MSDPNASAGMTLGDALRALPLATPAHDGWSTLAAQLAPATPRRRHYYLPLSIAAACVLAIMAAALLRPSTHPQSATPLAATTIPTSASSIANGANTTDAAEVTKATNPQSLGEANAQLVAVQTRSQALERWLRDTGLAASPLPSQDLIAATELENLIGVVDIELASAPVRALPLWQRRVALLEDLTALRYSNYRLAETAATASTSDSLNRIN